MLLLRRRCWARYESYEWWHRFILSVLFGLVFFPDCARGFCPSKCSCDNNILEVHCKNATIDIIPFLLNPEIKFLYLPLNNIKEIGQSLAFYPELREIDLSANALNSLQPSDFENQEKLEILNLKNNVISVIPSYAFSKVVKLIELYFNQNLISAISSTAFSKCFKLQVLDISNNRISNISENAFIETTSLKVVKLSYNHLVDVPSRSLNEITSLEVLDLSGNFISDISAKAFAGLGNLSSLLIDKNNISVVYPNAFQGLAQLEALSLKDNKLTAVTGIMFQHISMLESLDLSGNLFAELGDSYLSHLLNLKHLVVSRCPRLQSVGSKAFAALPSLKTLSLSHNVRLARFHDSVFQSLTSLTDLDLTACSLVHLDASQLPGSSDIRLRLAGNPLNCNCSLLWLANRPFNRSLHLEIPTCATPATLYGLPVNQLDSRMAGCPHRLSVGAIGTCVGIILLSLLAAGLFLVWRYRRHTQARNKAPPYITPESSLRQPWNRTATTPDISVHGGPVYGSKFCHSHGDSIAVGRSQCVSGCPCSVHALPYSSQQITRPLLPPSSPALKSHNAYTVDRNSPNHYEDDFPRYSSICMGGGKEAISTLNPKDRMTYMPSFPMRTPSPPPISTIPTGGCQWMRQNRPSQPAAATDHNKASVVHFSCHFDPVGVNSQVVPASPATSASMAKRARNKAQESVRSPVTYI